MELGSTFSASNSLNVSGEKARLFDLISILGLPAGEAVSSRIEMATQH